MATLIKRPIRPSTKVTKKTAEKSDSPALTVLKKALPTSVSKAVWGSSKKKLY